VTHTRQPNRPTRRPAARRVLSVTATALATAGLFAAPAFAANETSTVRVTASDDSYTSSSRPSYMFGSSASIVAGTKGGDRMVSYLKFKVGTLPAGASVQKVELKLTRDPSTALPSSVKVRKVANTSWTEAALSGRNAPAVGSDVASASPKADAATVTFNLTGSIAKAGTYTFAVASPATNAIARFRSTEQGSTGPQLTLTLGTATTPVPVPDPAPVETAPAQPAPSQPAPADPSTCTVSEKLVPTCNVLWGAAAGGFSETPRDQALREWEAKSGRTASIYHTYHKGDEQFPTKAEIAMANEPGKPRILFTNWKVGYGTKWSKVASGGMDARIDKLSAHIKANYTAPFFMAIHHEPENDVSTTAGSGMTAKDYAAMFRHTVQRMRANGVNNVVFVMAYMNVEKWNNSSWWWDLYPGNDVVDWVAVDSYINAQPGGFHHGDFNYLMNRTNNKAFPGWYNWAVTKNKPIMLAEWAVYECKTKCDPNEKAKLHATVVPQLKGMPAIKAVVAFDTASDQQGLDMRIDSTPQALTSFQKIAADPMFQVRVR
jgi:Glycosyl hydrolase family 26